MPLAFTSTPIAPACQPSSVFQWEWRKRKKFQHPLEGATKKDEKQKRIVNTFSISQFPAEHKFQLMS